MNHNVQLTFIVKTVNLSDSINISSSFFHYSNKQSTYNSSPSSSSSSSPLPFSCFEQTCQDHTKIPASYTRLCITLTIQNDSLSSSKFYPSLSPRSPTKNICRYSLSCTNLNSTSCPSSLSPLSYLRKSIRLLRIPDRAHRLERQIPLIHASRPLPFLPFLLQFLRFHLPSRAQRPTQQVFLRLPHLLQQFQHVQLLHTLLHQPLQRTRSIRARIPSNVHRGDLIRHQTILNPHLQHQSAYPRFVEFQ